MADPDPQPDLDEAARPLSRAIRRIAILYEDDHLVAVDKPPGLLVVPDRYDRGEPTLVAEMAGRLRTDGKLAEEGRLFVVHRIDRGTSGIVLFAKDRDTHKALSTMFADRQVSKTYQAIVNGELASDAGRIDLPIGLHPGDRSRMTIRKRKGRESQTDFRVLERFVFYSYLELQPATGRQHQIRVHLQAIGHPVVGDEVYGDGKGVLLSELKRSYRPKSDRDENPLMGRLALHAAALEFAHPGTGQPVRIEADLPKDFQATLRNLTRFLSN